MNSVFPTQQIPEWFAPACLIALLALVIIFAIIYLLKRTLTGDRILLTKALHRSREEWERTFHAIPDIVTLLDRDLRVIKINRSGCLLFDSPCSELTGRHCHELFGGGSHCPACPELDSLDDFQPYTTEIFHEKLQKFFLVTVSPVFDEQNNLLFIAHVAKDITEYKRLEKQLFLSEKLRTIAGLAAGVAHEINTPLSAILQSAQILQNALSPDHASNHQAAEACGLDLERLNSYCKDQELDFYLDGIRSSALKASNIITSLLDFSRPRKGKMIETDINQLLDSSLELARADYDLKNKYDIMNVRIIREYDQNLPPVTSVPVEIEQVILNLIKNSVQAMADGPAQEPPFLAIRTGRQKDGIRIEVEDNGPGITEQDKKHIFDPFYTTKDAGLGTGLGLSVSYTIIHDKHGGSINVDSEPGKGTKFIITLPCRQVENRPEKY